ncbi:MAG: hypothetical protein R3B96_17810 [Pirellulaceae bacterium]
MDGSIFAERGRRDVVDRTVEGGVIVRVAEQPTEAVPQLGPLVIANGKPHVRDGRPLLCYNVAAE